MKHPEIPYKHHVNCPYCEPITPGILNWFEGIGDIKQAAKAKAIKSLNNHIRQIHPDKPLLSENDVLDFK
jgi:hypothetical protein